MQINPKADFGNKTPPHPNRISARSRSAHVLAIPVLLLAIVCLCQSTSAAPQLPGFPKPGNRQAEKPDDDLQRLYTERRVVHQLSELDTAARKKQKSDFRDLLDGLRSADPALMVPGPNGTFIPLHRNLVLRIQEYPSEIVQEIIVDDSLANAALQRAIRNEVEAGSLKSVVGNGSASNERQEGHALVDVLHRFAGTDASWKAHLILAAIHADRGHKHVAAYWLAPLLTEKSPPKFKPAAEKINVLILGPTANSKPNDQIPAGKGLSTTPDHNAGSPTSDEDSANTPADAAPNEGTSGTSASDSKGNSGAQARAESGAVDSAKSQPADEVVTQHVHWMQSLPLSTQEKRRSQDLVQGASQHGILPWSAWEPIIDPDRLYVRTPQLISAYDRQTGKHIWTRTINLTREPEDETDSNFPPFRMPMNEDAVNAAVSAPEILSLHRNEMVGRMTADADRLFAVCQVVENRSGNQRLGANQLRFIMGRGEQPSGGLWELIAVEKATGRRLWTMGGPPVEARFGNDLAMAWFAGPPAVSGGQLYGVVEQKGAMQLTCLSASTGHLAWMMPLTYPDIAIGLDSARQLLSAWTRAEAGLVVTTTTTGWIFAIDQMTRSVLWARRLPSVPTAQAGLRTMRNPGFLQSQLQPFGKVWRSEVPILSDDSLIFAGAESSQLTVLEPVTGKVRHRSSADKATAILFCDPQLIVVSSPTSTIAYQRPKMRRVWSNSRSAEQPTPVGRGVKLGTLLLVPMSDGSIDAIRLTDGTTSSSLKGLRPPFSSGALYSSGNDVISHAPDHLAVMSTEPADRIEANDPLQQALFLMETGNFPAAKTALKNVQVHAMNSEHVRRLNFRIALGMYAKESANPDARLEEISSLARTSSEKALSAFLRLDRHVSTFSEVAFATLADALKEGDAILSIKIPAADHLHATLRSSNAEDPLVTNSLIDGAESLRRPLRSWILLQLRRLLQSSSDEKKGSLVQLLKELSDEDLLEMHANDLSLEYLRRAEAHVQAGTWNESTLHFLMAVVTESLKRKTETPEARKAFAARIGSIFDQLQSLAGERFGQDPGTKAIVQRLLLVKRYELLSAMKVDDLLPLESARDVLQKRWSEFNGRSYSMLPVNTNGQMMVRNANLVPVEVNSDEDQFLTAYNWTLRHEPGGLIAESILDRSLPNWTIKSASTVPQFSMSEDEVLRLGTVVIVKRNTGLSAFSLVDQRWLWHREMPAGVPRRMNAFANRPFREFNAFTSSLVLTRGGNSICGANDRWVCLLSDGRLEVLDLLTGHSLWEIGGVKSPVVVGCDKFISALALAHNEKINVDPIDGTPTEIAATMRPTDAAKIILGAGKTLAVWNDSEGDPSIDWMDPETDEVIRSVPLKNMVYAHFMNPETLVALTEEQTFIVVNLRTGSSQTLNYATEQGATPDSSQLSAPKIAVAADAVNYYVFERSDDGVRAIPSLYTLHAEPVSKVLYAVNRQTGKLAWSLATDNDLLVCIQPCATSALLSININDQPLAANAGILPNLGGSQRYKVAGISRMTGTPLFSYPIVAQFPTGNFRLTETPAGQLDLDALGNRVRYFPVSPATAPDVP